MMTLAEIFADPPHVAGSATSRMAAESMKAVVSTDRDRVFAAIQLSVVGMTCDDVEVKLDMRHQSASARIRELAKSGDIVDTGARRATRSGRKAVVYAAKVPT